MTRFHRLTAALLCAATLLCVSVAARAEPLEGEPPITLTAPSAILLEAENGAVIFEKNADERRPVASVTKLMTLLLLFERLDAGEIGMEDKITVSPNAAAQPGSQALLDAHATYPLRDLLKSTVIASGNDSAVALAEYVAGTEEAFRGGTPSRAWARARMWSGVVPQQPPAKERPEERAACLI